MVEVLLGQREADDSGVDEQAVVDERCKFAGLQGGNGQCVEVGTQLAVGLGDGGRIARDLFEKGSSDGCSCVTAIVLVNHLRGKVVCNGQPVGCQCHVGALYPVQNGQRRIAQAEPASSHLSYVVSQTSGICAAAQDVLVEHFDAVADAGTCAIECHGFRG